MTDNEPNLSRISRRAFLGAAGAGVAAGAVIGIGGTIAVAKTQSSAGNGLPQSWDKTADVVVAGTGAAAFTAAVTAASKGSSVIMLEKASIYGGTTGKSGGAYWIPNNSLMRKNGLTDPKPDALKYLMRLSYPTLYDPASPTLGVPQDAYDLLDTYYDIGPEMADALATLGSPSAGGTRTKAPDFAPGVPYGNPDYYANLPENKAPYGRGLSPANGKGGAGLITQLKDVADKLKIPILLEHRVVKVYRNANGHVVGVQAIHGNAPVNVRAQKAVVFGTGGFTQNPEMRLNFLRGPIFGGCAVPSNTGDFVSIGNELGAAFGNMNNAFWAENPFELAMQNSSVPNDVWAVFGDSMVMVNRYGVRVVNEKHVYNERTQIHFFWDATHAEYPNLVLPMIYDDFVAKNPNQFSFRDPVPMPGTDSPLVISGATWEELSANIDARLAKYAARTGGFRLDPSFVSNLRGTISRFNSFATAGKDLDFGRGETPIELTRNGPTARVGSTPNPTMHPFANTGPYHAILLGGGTLDTKGGPKINTKSQVLDRAGKPIPGLYGAGNCIASPAAQAYWAGGGTLGPAMTFGYIAGLNAPKEPMTTLP